MKTITLLFFILFAGALTAQSLDGSRMAYTYLNAQFSGMIIDKLDDSKLSTKEEKLKKKFDKQLEISHLVHLENYLSTKLKGENMEVLPLHSVAPMSNSALNLDGYPFILFPKKTIKKNADKDISDFFMSTSLTISKQLVSITGMKPDVEVLIKVFDKSGEQLGVYKGITKSEEKLGSLNFVLNEKESFSKIDLTHAKILFDKMKPAVELAIDEAYTKMKAEFVN